MQEIDLLKRRVDREQKARKQAEFTLGKSVGFIHHQRTTKTPQ